MSNPQEILTRIKDANEPEDSSNLVPLYCVVFLFLIIAVLILIV